MKVDVNTVVTLEYTLLNDETKTQIEATTPEKPMQFLYGVERLLPDFEVNIHGLSVGESALFSIGAEAAYGTHDTNKVVQLPVSTFHDEAGQINTEHIFVGAVLPMSDQEGNQLLGTIKGMSPELVEMDFNHPLAGIPLQFDVKIVGVRAASQDEIAHGHTHGEHGHHH